MMLIVIMVTKTKPPVIFLSAFFQPNTYPISKSIKFNEENRANKKAYVKCQLVQPNTYPNSKSIKFNEENRANKKAYVKCQLVQPNTYPNSKSIKFNEENRANKKTYVNGQVIRRNNFGQNVTVPTLIETCQASITIRSANHVVQFFDSPVFDYADII